MLLDDDAKLLLLAGAVSLLRGASLRLGAVLAGTTLRARAEEHPVALLELHLERLDSSCSATRSLPCAAISALVKIHDAREEPAILGFEKNGCLPQHFGIILALEVDAHDPVVMLDADRGRKSEPTLRSTRCLLRFR